MANPIRAVGPAPITSRPVEGMLRALAIPKSGLSVYSRAAEIIAQNIANAEVTKTPEGGPYKRQVVTFRRETRDPSTLGGATIAEVHSDPAPGRLLFQPGHPDAGPDGFVRLPNVDLTQELADLMLVRRLHEANATAFNAAKAMVRSSLGIGG